MIWYECIGKRYWSFLSLFADRFQLAGTQEGIAALTFE